MLEFFKKFAYRVAVAALGWALLAAFGFVLVLWVSKEKEPRLQPGSLLAIDLNSAIEEAPPPDSSAYQLAVGMGLTRPGLQLHAVLQALDLAANDPFINGIVLKASCVNWALSSMALGQAKELRDALITFRQECSKPVHAFLDGSAILHYYVASAADTVTLMPQCTLNFSGVGGSLMFWGAFFEKYGIGVDGVSAGTYKTAIEKYTRTGFTPESREQRKVVFDSIWQTMKEEIAASRMLPAEKLQSISEEFGVMAAEEFLAEGLADELLYWDGFLDKINPLGTLDSKTKIVRQLSLSDYISLRVTPLQKSQKNQIAVVYAQGPVLYEKPRGNDPHIHGMTLASRLAKLRKDDAVKAVVLRIDTPGGAADAGWQIEREVFLLKQAKPVVVSMSTVAASAGYLMAARSSFIFAQPTTITGSVGVLAVAFNAKKLGNEHGLYWDKVATGPYVGFCSPSEPNTPEQRARRQKHCDDFYKSFTELVSQGRNIPLDQLDSLAQGRVWSGSQAVENGLADALGGLQVAIEKARDLAQLAPESYSIEEYGSHCGQFTLADFILTSDMLTQLLLPESLRQTQVEAKMLQAGPAYYCP